MYYGILGLIIILSFIDVYDRIPGVLVICYVYCFSNSFRADFPVVPKKMPTWSKDCMRIYCVVLYIYPFVIFPPLWWMMLISTMLLLKMSSILFVSIKVDCVIIMSKKVYIKKWDFREIYRGVSTVTALVYTMS